jgi:PAS domain S-box-containing protein
MKLHDEHLDFSEDIVQLEEKVAKLISENKELKNKMGELNNSLFPKSLLFDSIPIPIFTSDELGNIFHCNDEFRQLIGIKDIHSEQINIFDYVSEEDQIRAKENFSKVLSGNNLSPNNYKCLNQNKEKINLTVKSKPYLLNNRSAGLITTVLNSSKNPESVSKSKLFEERYLQLIEQSEDAIFLLSNSKISFVNNHFVEMFGYSREEIQKADFNVSKIISPECLTVLQSKISELQTGQLEKFTCELTAKNKDAEELYCNLCLATISENESIHIQGVIKNITTSKNAERELRNTKSFLQAAIEQSPAGILIVDATNRKIRIANQAALEIFGLDKSKQTTSIKVFDKIKWKFLSKEGSYIESNTDPLERVLNKGEYLQNEETLVFDSRGYERYLSINAAPIYDHAKDIIAGVMVLMDISKQKLVEQNIRKSEELFRGIYENASVGIFRISYDGKHNLANPALLNLLGYKSEEEIKHDFPNKWLPSLEGFIRYLNIQCTKNDKCIIETKFVKPNGEKIDCSVVVRKIEEIPGEKYYYEGIVEDITKQKIAEHALIEAKESAENSDRLKTEFLAQMSHEIRTPINTILSFTSLVEEEIADRISEDLEMSFDYISRSGNRIIRTIDLILHMAELQTGTYDYSESNFDIYSDVIENLYPEFLRPAKDKGLKLSIYNEMNDPVIRGDKSSVVRIFQNLIDNAIKYTKEGSINITVKENDNSKVVVEVKDTGIGIGDSYLDYIFKPFTQEDQGYTRKYEGNGLGLALVRKYAELNKAKIEVDSEKGKGSTFKVIFN